MNKPQPDEFPAFYQGYVNQVTQNDGIVALKESGHDLETFIKMLPEAKATYRYAPGKWSVNEVLQHLIDCEIVFCYRALSIARGDQTPLPGFEQDDYVAQSFADYKSITELADFFKKTRALSLALFQSLPKQVQTNSGNANGNPITVRALCHIIAGHTYHHLNILKTRYV